MKRLSLIRGFHWTKGVLAVLVIISCASPAISQDAKEKSSEETSSSAPKSGNSAEPLARWDVDKSEKVVTNGGTIYSRNMDALDGRQKLAVGDRVSFRVLEDQEDAKLLVVTDAGELDVPELGLVSAVNKSCKELAQEIRTKLEQTTYFKATVIIGIDLLNKTLSGRKVYVVGQVKNTGPQEIPAGETWTVSRAIMKAGGFTNFADKKKVRLVRGGASGKPGQTFFVNIAEIWEKGKTETDLAVEPEDLIYVSTRAVNFY